VGRSMVDTELLAKAHGAVADLLKTLEIKQVICVDDVYARRYDLADVQASQIDLPVDVLLTAMPELGDGVPEDREARREKFRVVWSALLPDIQAARGEAIYVAARTQPAGRGKRPG